MDRLDAMQLFVRVVETGSFSKAAKEFATTQPTVTKQVAALEDRLKVRLLNRNTRGVSLTEPGALYYDKCKSIVREANDADDLVRQGQGADPVSTRLSGLLRVNTSVAFGRRVVVPLALDFMAQHPGLQLDLSFDDRYADLVAQGLDVAVRMGRLADSSLGARFLGMNPWALVAAPAYLAQRGEPTHPQMLKQHPALIYSSVQGDDGWRLTGPDGQAVTVVVKGPFRSNNLSAVLAAARAGLGVAAMPWYVAAESIAQGRLQQVLAGYHLPEQEIHAVFPSPKLVPLKVQVFTRYLQGRFGASWWTSLPRL